jgi:hypothetical protein
MHLDRKRNKFEIWGSGVREFDLKRRMIEEAPAYK